MKIFEIIYKDDEKQYVAANTNIEALQEVLSIEETDLDLMIEIKEVEDNKLDEFHVVNNEYDETDDEDWETKSFREFLSECISVSIVATYCFSGRG